jgi:hypothetical protein
VNPGVIIEKGPEDWQVIQQEDGKAHIRLEGYFIPQDQCRVVYARVVDEETGPLYKNMTAILANHGPIKGILWYQSCGDTGPGDRDSYLERFQGMVRRLRGDLKNPALPFLTVQLARLTNTDANHTGWGMIREAQRRAAENIENVFVVPTTDCTLSDAIHLSASGNLVLGERLAGVALRRIYGKRYGYEAPNIKSVCRTGVDGIRLTFAPVYNRLYLQREHDVVHHRGTASFPVGSIYRGNEKLRRY